MKEDASGGWVKIHRQLTRWEWYTDANTFRVFLHLLLMANHADTRWRGQTVRRGQVLTGLNQLSFELKLSVQQIRTALGRLIATGEITNRSTSRYRVITICNYDAYQKRDEGAQQAEEQAGAEAGNKRPTASKKVKKEKNEEPPPPARVTNPGFSESFVSEVWTFYAANKTKPYRNARVQSVALRHLHEMSAGSEAEAREALRQTLTNGYQGFTWYFNRNQTKGGRNAEQPASPTKADHAALMQAIAARTKGME